MSVNNKTYSFYSELNEINLQSEDGFHENHVTYRSSKLIEFRHHIKNNFDNKNIFVHSYYIKTLNNYLTYVQYMFEKGGVLLKKFALKLNHIPELKAKLLFQITLVLFFLVLVIFLVSCETDDQYAHRVNYSPLPKPQTHSTLPRKYPNNISDNKDREQLYIKRENLNIRQREMGSTTGSIWADAPAPKSLFTEFKPTRLGDVVTVRIPEELQFKPETNAQSNNTAGSGPQKSEAIKSMKFQVIGIEPGGDVFLRATKNYVSQTGEQRNITVMAKMPRRDINSSEINATNLTELAVNESQNGAQSNYSSIGWDQTVSRKISDYAPDLTAQANQIDSQKKDLETQKKTLADQQKSLAEQADRLKKDRQRLDAQTARAKSLLESATVVGNSDTKGPASQANSNPLPGAGNASGAAKP